MNDFRHRPHGNDYSAMLWGISLPIALLVVATVSYHQHGQSVAATAGDAVRMSPPSTTGSGLASPSATPAGSRELEQRP
jgi:hypothetical protein